MRPGHAFLKERAGGCCEYCKVAEGLINFNFEIDHFVPVSAGGSDDPDNLVFSCRSCNSYKSFHQIGLMRAEAGGRLFNPRTDIWADHFRLDVDSAEIRALTKVWEGTIRRLRLNSEAQLRFRRYWLGRGEKWLEN